MDLSPTAYVILGFLSWRPMSGYDIKARVEESTRFFWAASYGQIYPELKRLAEAGLIEPEGEATDGRRRTAYTLTGEGLQVLQEWLAVEPDTWELRDDGLLKLFFASAAPATAAATLAKKRRMHADGAGAAPCNEGDRRPLGIRADGPRYGIEMQEWMRRLVRSRDRGPPRRHDREGTTDVRPPRPLRPGAPPPGRDRRGRVLPRSPARWAARSPTGWIPTAPTTPTPRRRSQPSACEDAGYRSTGVVVLVEDVDVASAAGRQRVEEVEAKVAADPDVEIGHRLRSTPAPTPSSRRTAMRPYLAASPLAHRRRADVQEAGERIEELLADEEGVTRRRARRRAGAGERAGRGGPAHGRAATPSRFSSCCRCSSSAAWSRRRCRCWSAASRSSARS